MKCMAKSRYEMLDTRIRRGTDKGMVPGILVKLSFPCYKSYPKVQQKSLL